MTNHKGKIFAFCELIEFLRFGHERWSQDPKANRKQRKLNDELSKTSYNVIVRGKLDNILEEVRISGTIKFTSGKDFLFLKPPDKEIVLPVLSIKGDLSKDNLSVRMALFTFDRSKGSEELSALGFRFETPHGDGLHNYHHMQMFRGFDKGLRELPNVPPWLPESQPALMMSATNPFSLFLGVLMGLYGLGVLEQEWRGQPFMQAFEGDRLQLTKGCGAL